MVGVEGTIGANPRGEPLLAISNWTLLAKALREPPDKHHGLNSPEMKYRHRELDLLSSADSRKLVGGPALANQL
jgi:lysyl-tRNA synthetase class 2